MFKCPITVRGLVQVYFRGELGCYFLPKAGLMIISNEQVPPRIIDGQNKLPGSFTDTFKVLDVIGLRCVDLLVLYAFGYANHRLLEVSSIRGNVLQQFMNRNGMEVTIP